MAEILIRDATSADAPASVALYQKRRDQSEVSFTPEEARAHFAVFLRYPNYRVFVVMAGGAIVGSYALLIMNNLAERPSGVVEDVVVAPEHQRPGNWTRSDPARTGTLPGNGLLQVCPIERNQPRAGARLLRIHWAEAAWVQFFGGNRIGARDSRISLACARDDVPSAQSRKRR
jgi:hypothetical protein